MKNRGHVLRCEERLLKDFGKGRGHWMAQLITIDSSGRASVDQNDASDGDRSIGDEGSRLILIS